jgi:RNA polymerase sigma-70 factor (ECF subfamily)
MGTPQTSTGTCQPSCTEEELIRLVRSGEKSFFRALIQPYERVMFVAAYSVLRNYADAEEAVQEGVLKAFLHLEQLQETQRFRAWLLQIVVNEARRNLRRAKRPLYDSLDTINENAEKGGLPRQFADWQDLPDEALQREELRYAIREAVEALPPIYREVYMLADMQQLNMASIAEVLGITVGLVKTRLHRARFRVQEKLSPVFAPRWSDYLRGLKGMSPWSRAKN